MPAGLLLALSLFVDALGDSRTALVYREIVCIAGTFCAVLGAPTYLVGSSSDRERARGGDVPRPGAASR